MTADHCSKCEEIFMASLTLQAEARHIALFEGPQAATSWLREKLADQHEGHS